MFKAGEMGMNFYLGFGGYYGYVLKGSVEDLSFNPHQGGINWCIGFQMGKFKISGERRYQLNPLFLGDDVPKARLHSGAVNISYLF